MSYNLKRRSHIRSVGVDEYIRFLLKHRQETGYEDMDAFRLAEEVVEWLAVLGTVMNI
jgi:hypothetical protein